LNFFDVNRFVFDVNQLVIRAVVIISCFKSYQKRSKSQDEIE